MSGRKDFVDPFAGHALADVIARVAGDQDRFRKWWERQGSTNDPMAQYMIYAFDMILMLRANGYDVQRREPLPPPPQ